MIQIIKKLCVLLDKKQKRTMVGLIILMVISAFLQTAGVGMLVEVMQIVIDPEAVQHSRVAEACYEIMGVESYRTFSIIVMVLLILVFVVKNLFTYVQQKLTLSFVYTNQFRTSERMMRNYLRRGYEFYLNADTAVVQRSITSDVNNMYALILALLQLLSDSVVSLFVISYCFISSGTMTILMAVVLLLLMWLIKRVLKPIMYKAGKDNQDYYSSLFKWISQTVQGIKEVKISGKEQYFVSEYRKCGKGYVDAVQRYSLYNQVPKLLIETACVATMVGYMIFLCQHIPDGEQMPCHPLPVSQRPRLVAVQRVRHGQRHPAYFPERRFLSGGAVRGTGGTVHIHNEQRRKNRHSPTRI